MKIAKIGLPHDTAHVGEKEQGCIHTEEKMGDISRRIFCGRHSIVTAYLDILMESAENIDQEDLSTSKILLEGHYCQY